MRNTNTAWAPAAKLAFLSVLAACGGSGGAASNKGESQRAAQAYTPQQMWVMENITTGSKWDVAAIEKKLGKSEALPMDDGNPRTNAYIYFPATDVTIFVRTDIGEIVTWRIGRETRMFGR